MTNAIDTGRGYSYRTPRYGKDDNKRIGKRSLFSNFVVAQGLVWEQLAGMVNISHNLRERMVGDDLDRMKIICIVYPFIL